MKSSLKAPARLSPPEDQSRVDKVKSNLFADLKYETFAPSAMNWGNFFP